MKNKNAGIMILVIIMAVAISVILSMFMHSGDVLKQKTYDSSSHIVESEKASDYEAKIAEINTLQKTLDKNCDKTDDGAYEIIDATSNAVIYWDKTVTNEEEDGVRFFNLEHNTIKLLYTSDYDGTTLVINDDNIICFIPAGYTED